MQDKTDGTREVGCIGISHEAIFTLDVSINLISREIKHIQFYMIGYSHGVIIIFLDGFNVIPKL
jgi:hypothetical protein